MPNWDDLLKDSDKYFVKKESSVSQFTQAQPASPNIQQAGQRELQPFYTNQGLVRNLVGSAPRTREADAVTKGVIGGAIKPVLGVYQELSQAGDQFKQGNIGQGAVQTASGLLHTAMIPATVPIGATIEGIAGAGNIGKEVATGLERTMNLPFEAIRQGSELTQKGLESLGIEPAKIEQAIGVTPELSQKANALLTELGGLYALSAAHKGAGKVIDETTGKPIDTIEQRLPKQEEPLPVTEQPKIEIPETKPEVKNAEEQIPTASEIPTISGQPVNEPTAKQVEEGTPQRASENQKISEQAEDVKKEPWQMTKDELSKIMNNPYADLPDYLLKKKQLKEKENWDNKLEKYHIQKIETAISEGKQVSPEVLADYPELQSKIERKAIEPITEQPIEPKTPVITPVEPIDKQMSKEPIRASAKNAFINAERVDKGLEPLVKEAVKTWGESLNTAREKMDSGSIDIAELRKGKKILTDEEQSALVIDTIDNKVKIKKLSDELDKTDETGKLEISTRIKALEDLNATNDFALVTGGTDIGRALSIRRMVLKDDYTPERVVTRARIANNGNVIPDEVKTKLTELSNELQSLLDKQGETESGKSLNIALEKVKELDAEAKREGRKAKREKKKQDLDAEYQDILKEFAGSSQLSAGLDPKQVQIAYKAIKNRAQKGYVSLEQLLDDVYTELVKYKPDMTKREFYDSISGYGKQPKAQTKDQLSQDLGNAKKLAALVSKLSDLESGKKPFKREVKKGEVPEEVKVLRDKIAKISKESVPEAEKLQVYKDRLTKRVEELQRKLDTGDFTAKPKKDIPFDEETVKLQMQIRDLKQQIEAEIQRTEWNAKDKLGKAIEVIKELPEAYRASSASGDMSAPLRQGLFLSVAHPVVASKAFIDMHKYFFSKDAYNKMMALMDLNPNKWLHEATKLAIVGENAKPNAREEMFQRNFMEKIPVVKHIIQASERAYVGYLNKLRADVFDMMVTEFQKQGKSYKDNKQSYDQLADFINVATGRGKLGKLERYAPLFNKAFFSTRLMASRLQTFQRLFNPKYYAETDPLVRKEFIKTNLATVGAGLALLYLAKEAGAETESDPRSADFGKIKMGRTRVDIWGGYSQYARFFAQMLVNQRKETETENIKDLKRYETLVRFVESKASPQVGLVIAGLKGRDFTGEKFEIESEAFRRLIPLYLQDVYEATQEYGTKGAVLSVPAFYGMGLQTYEKKNKQNENILEKLKERQK